MSVQNSFIDHTLVKGLSQNHEYLTALEVSTVQHCINGSTKRVWVSLMLAFVVEIIDGITVGKHDSVIVPFAAEDIHQKTIACAARNAFVTVISAHHFADIAFLDQSFESR